MSEIKVNVVDYGRRYLYMRYIDPQSGKGVAKSTGTNIKKEAVKVAAKWEAELQEGRYKAPSKVTWNDFRARYEDEVLNSLAVKTAEKVGTAFEALTPVDKLMKVDAAHISKFQRKLRDERNCAEATIKPYLAHLKAALNWAKRIGMLHTVPTFEMPKRAKGGKLMKGRAITTEEFDRMMVKIPDVLNRTKKEKAAGPTNAKPAKAPPTAAELARTADIVKRWEWFLQGLWFSGLRLGEAIDLSWDEPGHIQADLTGQYPMFIIPGDKQKSGEDQLLPIAPEFAEQLQSVPLESRTGRVFKLGRRNPGAALKLLAVSRLISEMGTLAKVVVNREPQKFASAHDFRRAFGGRWSTRVMPATLQQMMRHADINTTMKFYVGQNGQKAAADIYAAYTAKMAQRGNTSGNTSPKPPNQSCRESDSTSNRQIDYGTSEGVAQSVEQRTFNP